MSSSKKKQQVPDTLIRVGRDGSVYQQKLYRPIERAYGTTHEDSEDYEEVIVDRSAAEIIDQINKRVQSPYYSLYCGIAAIVFLFIHPFLFFILGIVTYVIYRKDIKRKTTPLFYEFSDEFSANKFRNGIISFTKLTETRNSWRLKSKAAISDWKRNAGSNSVLIRQRAKIGKQSPNLLKTNVEIWGVDAGSIKLYLLPDRFFVFQDGVYSAISYDEIQPSFQEIEYVEQEFLPSDATVIGKTWKYVRRDGGADRRFSNNRQLPIVRYGIVVFSSPNFVAYLIVSSLKIASSFTQSFSNMLSPSNTRKHFSSSSEKPLHPTFPDVDSSPEFLEPLRKAASRGSELTTSQIAQLLGLSNSVITKNSVSFDYERFRFTRAGRSGRQISWKVEYLDKR